jgi:hypothetical protein
MLSHSKNKRRKIWRSKRQKLEGKGGQTEGDNRFRRYPANPGNYEKRNYRYEIYGRHKTEAGRKEISIIAIPGTGCKTVLQDRFRVLVSFPSPDAFDSSCHLSIPDLL